MGRWKFTLINFTLNRIFISTQKKNCPNFSIIWSSLEEERNVNPSRISRIDSVEIASRQYLSILSRPKVKFARDIISIKQAIKHQHVSPREKGQGNPRDIARRERLKRFLLDIRGLKKIRFSRVLPAEWLTSSRHLNQDTIRSMLSSSHPSTRTPLTYFIL